MTEHSYTIDSSIWLAYFLTENEKVRVVIDSSDNILFTSVISLCEVKRKLIKLKKRRKSIEKALLFMRNNSIIIPVDDEVSTDAAKYCIKDNLHTIDALIYSTSTKRQSILITADYDFKKLKNTRIIR